VIALTRVVLPLGRAVALIPKGAAAAMPTGVLLPFCLKAAEAAQALPMVPRAFKLPVSRQTVFRVPRPSDRSKDACRQEGARGLCPSDRAEDNGCERDAGPADAGRAGAEPFG